MRRARDPEPGDAHIYLGEVTVDGGEILVADPGYIPPDHDAMLGAMHSQIADVHGWGGPVFDNLHMPGTRLAVALRLESDGGYPVFAEVGADGRVIRFTIEVALPDE